jgi:lipopolysaccharide/colanic/teichoic acid biosynthesis glycosyltransferase
MRSSAPSCRWRRLSSGELAADNAGAAAIWPTVTPASNSTSYVIAKRTLDILVSGALLLLLAPFLPLVALLIKLGSSGPVFYRWQVVGEGGRAFTGYKLRTMISDADVLKAQLLARNEMTGPVFKMREDPRITPLGRFLRRFSIDELPQLWSVLKGDMSLVGPRPPLQTEYLRFAPWQREKVSVRPGITCLWQVYGRNDIPDFDDWVRLDLEYIHRRSFLLDLKILAATPRAVVTGKGAH